MNCASSGSAYAFFFWCNSGLSSWQGEVRRHSFSSDAGNNVPLQCVSVITDILDTYCRGVAEHKGRHISSSGRGRRRGRRLLFGSGGRVRPRAPSSPASPHDWTSRTRTTIRKSVLREASASMTGFSMDSRVRFGPYNSFSAIKILREKNKAWKCFSSRNDRLRCLRALSLLVMLIDVTYSILMTQRCRMEDTGSTG